MKFYDLTITRIGIFTQQTQIALAEDEDPRTFVIDPDKLDWEHAEFDDVKFPIQIQSIALLDHEEAIDFQSDKARQEQFVLTRSESFRNRVQEQIRGIKL